MPKHLLRWSVVLFILNCSLPALAGLPPDRYTVVARTGQQVASAGGVFVRNFDFPSLANDGHVTFASGLYGSGVNAENELAVAISSDGILKIAARSGDHANAAGEVASFDSFIVPNPTSMNGFAFLSSFAVNGEHRQGVWTTLSGSYELIAQDFQPLPDHPDVHIRFPGVPATRASGEVAFFTDLIGSEVQDDCNTAIVTFENEKLLLALREGEQAPLLEANTVVGDLRNFHLAQDGSLGLHSELRGPSINDKNNSAFWYRDPSSALRLIAREGDSAPGLPSGVVYGDLHGSEININHKVAFVTTLGGTIAAEDRYGLFVDDNGVTRPIYVSDDPLPGLTQGLFAWYPQSVQLTDNGAVVSTLSMHTSSRFDSVGQGIWIWPEGREPQSVAYEGQPAAGLSDVTFDYVVEPAVNNVGQLFFLAILKGPGVTAENNIGVWSAGVDQAPELMWRKGELFELEPGDCPWFS